jgi:hypothetical protein
VKKKLLFVVFSIVWLWPKIAAAQCLTYNGRATVVQANGPAGPVVLSDTGNLDQTGGVKDASLLNASLPGLLSGEVAHATAIGGGSATRSQASVADLSVTVAGMTIGADFVMARANADCGSLGPTVSGNTEIDGLVVNGLPIFVTGSPNQTVSLPGGGQLILNEQTSSVQSQTGSITVNALHVSVPLVSDTVIASGFALAGGAASTFPRLRPRVVGCFPPQLSSITPNSGAAGTTFSVTLKGNNFDSSLTVSAGVIQVSNVQFVDAMTATAVFTIPSNASGSVNVTVSTTPTCANGQTLTSNAVPFTITSQPKPCGDHVTGGGFRKHDSPKHDFGVAGGFRDDGKPWGHMEFHDRDNDRKVHGTGVEDCEEIDKDTREIKGTADVDDQSGDQCGRFKFIVHVTHNDADDRKDTFSIKVFDECGVVVESEGEPAGSTTLEGGHVDKDP